MMPVAVTRVSSPVALTEHRNRAQGSSAGDGIHTIPRVLNSTGHSSAPPHQEHCTREAGTQRQRDADTPRSGHQLRPLPSGTFMGHRLLDKFLGLIRVAQQRNLKLSDVKSQYRRRLLIANSPPQHFVRVCSVAPLFANTLKRAEVTQSLKVLGDREPELERQCDVHVLDVHASRHCGVGRAPALPHHVGESPWPPNNKKKVAQV